MCADSIASGKLSASSRNSFGVMALLSSNSCSVQRHLPQKKEKRESKRYTDEQCSNHRQPKKPNPQTFAFALNKPDQHDCRNDDIHRKERADAVAEQFTNKQCDIQAVFQEPRHKLRVGENQSEQTADQVEMSRLHGCISSHAAPKSVEEVHPALICFATAFRVRCVLASLYFALRLVSISSAALSFS